MYPDGIIPLSRYSAPAVRGIEGVRRTEGVFQSHTELTELIDIISFDATIFCAFRAFRVPLFGPTDYPCPSVSSVCPCHRFRP